MFIFLKNVIKFLYNIVDTSVTLLLDFLKVTNYFDNTMFDPLLNN